MLNSTAATASVAYLLVLHGSHDQRYQAAIAQLSQQLVMHLGPIVPYQLAYLECSDTPLAQQIADFAQALSRGPRPAIAQLQIVPLFLLPGVHVMEDLPAAVAQAQQQLVQAGVTIDLVVQDYLGSPTDQAPFADRLQQGFLAAAPGTQRLIVAHGTRRSGGNQPVEALAQAVAATAAYWFVAPSLADRVQDLYDRGHRRVVVLPYVLVEGALTEGIDQQLGALRQQFPDLICERLPALDRSGVLLDRILARCQSSAVVQRSSTAPR